MYEDLLARIARALSSADVPFMVIGGLAVLRYGEPRFTRDIDLTLGVAPGDWDRVLEAVTPAGFEPVVDHVQEFVIQTCLLPVRDHATGVMVDLAFNDSPFEEAALQRAQSVELAGVHVPFASLEDLIIYKLVAGRPRDLQDVEGMLVRHRDFDVAYVRHWLTQFAEALEQPCDERFEQLFRETR